MGPSDVRVVVVVRFRSRLSDEEVARRYPERMPEFRKVEGLVQKYYIRDASTGEWGGIYLWNSAEAAQKYLSSDLRATIPSFYEIEGAPRIETFTVVDTLRV